jgi:hypothetical protein
VTYVVCGHHDNWCVGVELANIIDKTINNVFVEIVTQEDGRKAAIPQSLFPIFRGSDSHPWRVHEFNQFFEVSAAGFTALDDHYEAFSGHGYIQSDNPEIEIDICSIYRIFG